MESIWMCGIKMSLHVSILTYLLSKNYLGIDEMDTYIIIF